MGETYRYTLQSYTSITIIVYVENVLLSSGEISLGGFVAIAINITNNPHDMALKKSVKDTERSWKTGEMSSFFC